MATRTFTPRLESRGTAHHDPQRFRQQITTRTARTLGERLLNRDRVALYSGKLFADTKRKPDDVYEMTRAEHRITHLPDDELRVFVERHIADGTITPRSLALFMYALGRDYVGLFPAGVKADDQLWSALFKEGGEMFDAQVRARANPTREALAQAVQQTEECIAVATVVVERQRVAL